MHNPGETETGKRRDILIYRLALLGAQLLVFLALVALSTVLLRPLQRLMQSRMTHMRDELLARAELRLDRWIEYGSMAPSIFGALDIRNIRIYAEGADPVVTIDRFRVAYRLWDLVRGRIPESIRSIRIDRPALTLDLKRDADLGSRLAPGSPSETDFPGDVLRKAAALIPEDLLVRVRGGEFRLLAAGNTVRVEGLNFEARAEGESFFFSGKWSAQAELAGFFKQTLGAVMSGRIDGELSRDLSSGSIQFQIPAFSGDFFVFRSMTVNLSLAGKHMEIRKINDRLPVDFSLHYDFESRSLNGSFRAEDFSPGDLISLTGSLRKYNPYLGIRSTGYAVMQRGSQGGASYEIDLSGSLQAGAAAGRFAYAVAGKGDRHSFEFTRCELQLPRGELSYSGGLGLDPLMPNGVFHAQDFSPSGNGNFNGDFAISSFGRTIEFFGENVSLGAVELAVLDGVLVREDRGLSFSISALRFRNIESYEDVQLSSLSLEGSFDQEPRHLQASLALDSFSLSDIVAAVRPFLAPELAPKGIDFITDDVSITTEVFVTTDFEHILYNAPRLVVVYSGNRDIYTLISLSGTDSRFELSQGRVVWAEGGAELAGRADFSNPDDVTFSFQTSYQDMFYFLDGEYLDRRSFSARGSYGFQAYVSATDQGGYSGYAEAASIPIPIGGQAARLSFLVSLRYDDPRYWSVTVDHFDVQDMITPVSPITSLGLSGEIHEGGLLFRRMIFDDGQGPLNGRAIASWGEGFFRPSGELTIRSQQGAEIVRASVSYDGEEADINFSGTAVQLGRFLRDSHNTVFTGNGNIRWRSPDSFSAAITLSDLDARIGDNDLAVAGSALINQNEVALQGLQLGYNALELSFSRLRIDRLNSYAGAEAQVRGSFMGRVLDAAFTMELDFAPINSWFNLSRAMDAFNGALFVQNLDWENIQSRQPFSFVFSRDHAQMSLSGGPGDMLRMQIDGDGSFFANLSNPAPFRGSVVGVITGKTIDAQTTNLYVDMGSLWRFIPGHDIISVPGGFLDASVEIRGSLGDPEFFGTARAHSLRLRVPQFLRADIEPVPATITLEGNEMSFGPIPARVGSGAGIASGSFSFDRWAPNVFSIDVQVPDDTPIPFGVDIAGIQADGDASGHLVLGMEDLVFRVNGDLTGNNTEINLDTQQFSWQALEPAFSAETALAKPVTTDIRITTGPKVEFVYPSREFPVIRANAGAGTTLRITSDSLSGRFTVDGDVGIRNGEIYYFQRSFYIREGILSFNETNEEFDPLISARAEARDRTDDGPVTISMIVDNSPLRSFTPRFESNPALSQAELFSLLGQNFAGTPSEDPNESIRSMVYAGGDFLTQFYLLRRGERLIRDFIHMDMFSVRTQVLQNILIQNTGLRDPVDTNDGVGNYFDNTTVFLGKYFGPDIFGQAMLSFRYDENRTTFGDISQGGLTLGGGVSLEADLGLELRGPLFDIQFNFAPRHLEKLFVDDLSFTLSWKRSIRNLSDLWKEP
ncbi:MAG: translocation/assembly module TamB [Treponema sp.]|nr:translocation/assembly module TamB [Treponema sp.]